MMSELRRFYEAQPFKPFEIRFDDGRKVVIDDPIHIGFSDKLVFFAAEGDAVGTARVDQLREIRPVSIRSGRNLRNGKRRRKA